MTNSYSTLVIFAIRYNIVLVYLSLILCPFFTTDDVKVSIREWEVPTPNSRPHDPEVAPDVAVVEVSH